MCVVVFEVLQGTVVEEVVCKRSLNGIFMDLDCLIVLLSSQICQLLVGFCSNLAIYLVISY